MKLNRILLTAASSGSGKTMITCGLLAALKKRGEQVVSFKCGPDYIDPMFHRTVLDTPSRNLDTYFTDEAVTRYLLLRGSAGADLAVIEGVMGYYDGLGGMSDQASAYDVARVTKTPSILIVNTKGMSLSVLPLIKGFMEFRPDSMIQGVILNRMSGMLYPRIKKEIEEQLGIKVLGYVPQTDVLKMESRHLGLVMPSEIAGIRESLDQLADLLEDTLDIDGILSLAGQAEEIEGQKPEIPHIVGEPTIALARDEAFCFYYEDNLALLREAGAKLVEFSPLHDQALPEADGLLLGGGYPELHLETLSANQAMLAQLKMAVQGGVPTMAECGGFMTLLDEMEDMEGKSWPVVGAIRGRAYRTKRLQRFGYIELTPKTEQMLGMTGAIRGHEFHYFDTTNNGEAFAAKKPLSNRGWDAIQANAHLVAGFPHLYYYANPKMAAGFVAACAEYKKKKEISTCTE